MASFENLHQATLRLSDAHRLLTGGTDGWAPNSPADLEVRKGGRRPQKRFLETVRGHAMIVWHAQGDRMAGLASNLRPDNLSVLAVPTLARPFVEGGAKLWWLLEDGLTLIQRAERGAQWRVDSLGQSAKDIERVSPSLPGAAATQRKRIQEVVQKAREAGVETDYEKGRLKSSMPRSRELVGSMYDTTDSRQLGEMIYGWSSGPIHSSLVSLSDDYFQVEVQLAVAQGVWRRTVDIGHPESSDQHPSRSNDRDLLR